MSEPIAISDAIRAAAEVVTVLADRAVSRLDTEEPALLSAAILSRARELSETAPASEKERRAASVAAGVTGRVMESLKAAPTAPQSLIHNVDAPLGARAATLDALSVWRLAGRWALASHDAVERARRFDTWVRSTFLLLESVPEFEPNDPSSLWIIVHAEASDAGLIALAEIAARLAADQPSSGFAGSLLACEHAALLDPGPREPDHPVLGTVLASAPRYAFSEGRLDDVPSDFHEYLFNQA